MWTYFHVHFRRVSSHTEELRYNGTVLYTHVPYHNDTMIKTHAGITDAMIMTDAMIKTQEDFFIKIFTSHFIARVRKGCVGFYCEREPETEHNWNILAPKLWSATLCLSSPDPNSIRAPEGPLGGGVFPYHISSTSDSNWLELNSTQLSLLFNSSALYYLQTPTQWYGHASTPPQFLLISGDQDMSLPLFLEWPMWSPSSGNNCHAVQRSLSSGASVYESIIGFFFISSHFISQFLPTRFLLITAIRMCHFLPVHHLEWHFWPGQKVKT